MGHKPADDGKTEPSLELPSVFGRKKKVKDKAPVEGGEDKAASTPEAPDDEPADEEPTRRIPHEEPVAQQTTRVPTDDEPTVPLFVEDTRDRQTANAPSEPEPADEAESEDGLAHRSDGDGFSLPTVPGRLAAIITGLVVGAFGTVLTYLALAGCKAVRGASSCGGPGFFLLVGILVLMILLGALLLKAWKVSDPGSTSFLAVGVVAVIVLVTLIEVIFSAWMFLLVPIISAGSYVLSQWVTTRFVDEAREGPPPHDVR